MEKQLNFRSPSAIFIRLILMILFVSFFNHRFVWFWKRLVRVITLTLLEAIHLKQNLPIETFLENKVLATFFVKESITLKNTKNRFENPTKFLGCGLLKKRWNFLIGWFPS